MNNRSAYSHSIKLLAIKDFSVYKLREKLLAKDYDSDEINETIELLIENKYLREDLYIEARVKGLAKKGNSKELIIKRLQKENVSVSINTIEDIYHEFEIDENDIVNILIHKKINNIRLNKPNITDIRIQQKLATYLNSKGYNFFEFREIILKEINSNFEHLQTF